MAFWTQAQDRALQALREQAREARRLQAVAAAGPARQQELTEALPGLEATAKRARKQADRKARGGVWTFPHLTPEKQAKAAEQAEQAAREADRAYRAARQELNDLERDLPHAAARLTELEGCEAEFQALLEQKAARLLSRHAPAKAELEELTWQRDRAAHRARVLRDALAGGKASIPLLTKFAQRIDDLRLTEDSFLSFGLFIDKKWHQAQAAIRAVRAPLLAYCAPDFPSPVSEALKAACYRWLGRVVPYLDRPYFPHHSGTQLWALMTQAENLRGHIRDTFPMLETAVEESAEAAARAARRREDFVCDTPVPRPTCKA